MFRKGQPNRFKLFYYSHPYFVIFNVLIIYNIILIALAALVMTYLMDGVTNEGITMGINIDSYLKNLEYCAVFTMNNGGIYNQAPISVVIMKIILSVLQMITFTGALIGLATSILQGMFRHRIENVGKIKKRSSSFQARTARKFKRRSLTFSLKPELAKNTYVSS